MSLGHFGHHQRRDDEWDNENIPSLPIGCSLIVPGSECLILRDQVANIHQNK